MLDRFFPAKLLLVLAGKGSGKIVVEASRLGGARGGTKFAARTLPGDAPDNAGHDRPDDGGRTEYIRQDAVLILMWDEAERVVQSVLQGLAGNPEPIEGVAMVLDAPKTFVRPGLPCDVSDAAKGESMKSGSMMIVSITNHGEAESLMHVARKAGARGGTIINARGTGTEDDTKYFGISLVPEKEILIIVSDDAHADAILDELGRQPLFSEPGGGIIFATPVERFIRLNS